MKLDKYQPRKLKKESQMYVIYARKSSESEDKQVASVQSQLDALQDIIKSKGLQVVETFTENKSAKKPGRPEFNRMVKTLNERKIKGIICWKPNRLFRNPQDEGIVRQLLSDGTIKEIVTPTKTYSADDSDFLMAIEGAQAQRFIRDLREDTKRGMQSKIDKGLAPILAPAGYINDKHMNQGEKTISPNPVYFDLVRKIFELAMTGNFSTDALAKKAKEMGIRNNRDKLLSRTQMYKTLRNPFYTGRFLYTGILHQGYMKLC
jgi:site-specific DNA recombinase